MKFQLQPAASHPMTSHPMVVLAVWTWAMVGKEQVLLGSVSPYPPLSHQKETEHCWQTQGVKAASYMQTTCLLGHPLYVIIICIDNLPQLRSEPPPSGLYLEQVRLNALHICLAECFLLPHCLNTGCYILYSSQRPLSVLYTDNSFFPTCLFSFSKGLSFSYHIRTHRQQPLASFDIPHLFQRYPPLEKR